MKKLLSNLINENHKIGFLFDLLIQFLIILSILLFILDTFFYEYLKNYISLYQNLEYLILSVFTLEYLLRTMHGKWKYIFSFYGIVDLLSFLPFYILHWLTYILGYNIIGLNTIKTLKLIRILKFFEHKKSRHALIISNIILLIFIITISSLTINKPINNITYVALEDEHLKELMHQKKIALVIGNNDYNYITSLKNAINDAELIDNTLREIGFKTILNRNISSAQEFNNVLRDFVKQAEKYDIRLIYYAGHAVQQEDENYLIPTSYQSAEGDCINDDFNLYGIKRILKAYSKNANGANILILDACRSNPCLDRSLGSNQGLVRSNPPRGSFFAYSTDFGETASDGVGEHSEYTKALAKHLQVPNIRLGDLFQNIRIDLNNNNITQMPVEENKLTNYVILNIDVK